MDPASTILFKLVSIIGKARIARTCKEQKCEDDKLVYTFYNLNLCYFMQILHIYLAVLRKSSYEKFTQLHTE